MQSILNDERLHIAGALDVSTSATGITPHRLPHWASRQILDPGFRFVQSSASGVHLVFATDSDAIELEVMLTGMEFEGETPPCPTVDLVVDGKVVAGHQTKSGARWLIPRTAGRQPQFQPGDPEKIMFAGLGRGMKSVEIWLPQNRIVEVRRLRIASGRRVDASAPKALRWVHYGSSISQCNEADRPTHTWPVVAARIAGVDLMNLGFGGQCQLDQVVARTIRDGSADMISAKIGINIVNADAMRERAFVPALHGFLDTVRDGHPYKPLLVVTPIIFPVGEDHPGPTTLVDGQVGVIDRPASLTFGALSIGRIRELTEIVVRQRRDTGDSNLHLLDGRHLFGPGDITDLPDGLHPNTAGYIRMGQRFAKLAFEDGPFASTVRTAAPTTA